METLAIFLACFLVVFVIGLLLDISSPSKLLYLTSCTSLLTMTWGSQSQEQIFHKLIITSIHPVIILLACLSIISSQFNKSHFAPWIETHLLRCQSRKTFGLAVILITTVLSSTVNNALIVSTLIPIVQKISLEKSWDSHSILLNLSFASMLGGTITLIGSSTNLIASSLLDPELVLDIFSLFKISLPASLIGAAYMQLTNLNYRKHTEQRCCLPYLAKNRSTFTASTCFLKIGNDSPCIGKTIRDAELQEFSGMQLCGVQRGANFYAVPPRSFNTLMADDFLTYLCTSSESVSDTDLRQKGLLQVHRENNGVCQPTLVAGVIPKYLSPLKNQECGEFGLKAKHGLILIAIIREGNIHSEGIHKKKLLSGDTIICYGSDSPNTVCDVMGLLANKVHTLSRPMSSLPTEYSYWRDTLIVMSFAGVLLAGIFQKVSTPCVALAIVLLGHCSGFITTLDIRTSLYQSRQVLLATGASLLLSSCFLESGLGKNISTSLLSVWRLHLLPLSFVVHLVTSLLSLVLSNASVVSILVPIMKSSIPSTQQELLLPLSISLIHGASCCFASPTGYHTNLMVHSIGGYRCKDFISHGLPLNIISSITVSLLVYFIYG